MLAPQPGENGNQDADDDEEAERNHPDPQPVPLALFPEPGLAVSKKKHKRSVATSIYRALGRERRGEGIFRGWGRGGGDVRVSELWPRQDRVGMVGALGFGLGDGGGRVDACVEGVAAAGDGRVEGFGVEVFEVDGFVIGPCHGIGHHRAQPREIWLSRLKRKIGENARFPSTSIRTNFRLMKTPTEVTSRDEP